MELKLSTCAGVTKMNWYVIMRKDDRYETILACYEEEEDAHMERLFCEIKHPNHLEDRVEYYVEGNEDDE